MAPDKPKSAPARGTKRGSENYQNRTEETEQEEPADSASQTKNVTAPRQSACVQAQLQVLRQNLERLMSERTLLQDVEMSFRQLLAQMDAEITVFRRMREMSVEAHTFMNDLCANDTLTGFANIKVEQDDPQPHCSRNPPPN